MPDIELLPPDKNEVSCRTCKYWDFHSQKDKDEAGICRRHAPAPRTGRNKDDENGDVEFISWPLTQALDWCGERAPDEGFAENA